MRGAPHSGSSSRREESPEVTEGGVSRRGSRSEATATVLVELIGIEPTTS